MYKKYTYGCHTVAPTYLLTKSIVMRLCAILSVISLHLSVMALGQKVTINRQQANLVDVIKEIRKQTGYHFLYDAEALEAASPVNVALRQSDLTEALKFIFNGQPLSYTIQGNSVIIAKREDGRGILAAWNQRTVSGIVRNENGTPLPGVTVSVTRSQTATETDASGRFVLIPGEGAKSLSFSMVGYVEETRAVDYSQPIEVVLKTRVDELDEVVVVGFGTQKKVSVVGAISTVDPKRLNLTPSRSLSNNLAGMVSGVLAVQRSGDPWNNNSSFWIRGISTFGGNRSPMVLIDGVERSLDNIEVDEVESFSVLKDASASAVYGVRGANGVIMITTKRGSVGAPKIDVRLERSVTSPTQMPHYVGSAKYLGIMNDIYRAEGKPVIWTDDIIEKYRNQSDPELYPDVNWWDAVAKPQADNMRVTANVSGGSNFLRYALVLGYFDENGIIRRDDEQEWNSSLKVKRYNVRSNVDLNITKSTLLRFNLGGFLQTRNGPPGATTDTDIFYEASMTPPFIHPTKYNSGEIPRIMYRHNPWGFATQRGYELWNHNKLESLVSLEEDMSYALPGLSAKLTFAFDKFSSNSVTRAKEPDYYNPAQARDANGNLVLVVQNYGQQFLGYSTDSNWGDQSLYLEGVINYSRLFADVHQVNAMAMYNQRNYDNGAFLPFRNQGVAGRLSYAYDSRYIAEVNFGYNGSENFARGMRYGFFPSVAAGWVISEERFMDPLKSTLSKLKLRGSWGYAGDSNIGGRRFAYLPTIETTGSYRWGVDDNYYRVGRAEGEVGVNDLTWETVQKTDLGLELGLWRNALDFHIDLFQEKRSDIFMQRSNVPGSSGFSRPVWANYGRVENHGIDFSLNVNKQFGRDWYLSVLANYTFARNRIVEQDEPLSIIGSPRARTGKPIDQLFGFISDGLFTAADFNANGDLLPGLPSQDFSKVAPGDIRYRDINGDGHINDLDKTAIGGTEIPEVVFGFGANVRYKKFDFGFFFQGVDNTYRVLGGQNWLPGTSNAAAGNIFTNIDDRWTPENPSQDVFWPRLVSFINVNNQQASTWWLRDMSFMRLRSVEVGYVLPAKWVNKVGAGNFRFFARGSNLLTFSDFNLWDPELGTNDGLKYPIMKSVSAGFSINFL